MPWPETLLPFLAGLLNVGLRLEQTCWRSPIHNSEWVKRGRMQPDAQGTAFRGFPPFVEVDVVIGAQIEGVTRFVEAVRVAGS